MPAVVSESSVLHGVGCKLVEYDAKSTGALRIELYDIHGRLVRSLADEPYREAGTFDLTIDGFDARGRRLPSGVYFIRGIATTGLKG